MQTVVGIGGKKVTTINKSDRNAIERVISMCSHCDANLDGNELTTHAADAFVALNALLDHFKSQEKPAAPELKAAS